MPRTIFKKPYSFPKHDALIILIYTQRICRDEAKSQDIAPQLKEIHYSGKGNWHKLHFYWKEPQDL